MIDRFYLENFEELMGRPLENPDSTIFVNAWYRKHLRLTPDLEREIRLDVTDADSVYGQIRACLHHPQVVVRIAMVLGLWSFFLSLIGIALAIVPLI